MSVTTSKNGNIKIAVQFETDDGKSITHLFEMQYSSVDFIQEDPEFGPWGAVAVKPYRLKIEGLIKRHVVVQTEGDGIQVPEEPKQLPAAAKELGI